MLTSMCLVRDAAMCATEEPAAGDPQRLCSAFDGAPSIRLFRHLHRRRVQTQSHMNPVLWSHFVPHGSLRAE